MKLSAMSTANPSQDDLELDAKLARQLADEEEAQYAGFLRSIEEKDVCVSVFTR